MHTTHIEEYSFVHDGDMGGGIIISKAGIQDGTEFSVEIPVEILEAFIAKKIRMKLGEKIENMTDKQLLYNVYDEKEE